MNNRYSSHSKRIICSTLTLSLLTLMELLWSVPSLSISKDGFDPKIENGNYHVHNHDSVDTNLALFWNSNNNQDDARTGRPPSRTSAGSRGACTDQLIAIVPGTGDTLTELDECSTGSSAAIAPTTASKPTLWLHIPEIFAGQEAKLVVLEGLAEPLMVQPIQLPNTGGIIGIPLAAELPLEAQYRWIFTVNLYPEAPSDNPVVGGLIERISQIPEHQRQLNTLLSSSTNLSEDITTFYREEGGLWHDILTQLSVPLQQDEMDTSPTISSTSNYYAGWLGLLEQEGLGVLEGQPILNCCPLETNTDLER